MAVGQEEDGVSGEKQVTMEITSRIAALQLLPIRCTLPRVSLSTTPLAHLPSCMMGLSSRRAASPCRP